MSIEERLTAIQEKMEKVNVPLFIDNYFGSTAGMKYVWKSMCFYPKREGKTEGNVVTFGNDKAYICVYMRDIHQEIIIGKKPWYNPIQRCPTEEEAEMAISYYEKMLEKS